MSFTHGESKSRFASHFAADVYNPRNFTFEAHLELEIYVLPMVIPADIAVSQ